VEKTDWERLRFEHVWRHLELHTRQRGRNFVVGTALLAAVYVLLAIAAQYSLTTLTTWACLLGVIGAGVFWTIDRCDRVRLAASEAALKEMEANHIAVPGVFYSDVFTKNSLTRRNVPVYAEAQGVFYGANIVALLLLGFGEYLGLFSLMGV
jgi:hypothetical protein